MQSLQEQFALYKQYHSQYSHRLMHTLGIALLLLGILILLSWVTISFALVLHISFAWIFVVLLLIYYFRLNIKLAAAMTVVLFLLTLLCSLIAFPRPTSFSLSLFFILMISGCVLLLLGNSAERIRNTFGSNLKLILMGPLFVLIEIIEAWGLEKYFNLPSEITVKKVDVNHSNEI